MKFLKKKNWILEWFSYLKYDSIKDLRSHDWEYAGNVSGIRTYNCLNCELSAHLGSVPHNVMDKDEIVFSYRNRIEIKYFRDKDGAVLKYCDETHKKDKANHKEA